MNKITILAMFLLLFSLGANEVSAEEFKTGQKIYSVNENTFICESFERVKERARTDIMKDIVGCSLIDFPHDGYFLGKASKVERTTIRRHNGRDREYNFVEVKMKDGKKWFIGEWSLRTIPATKEEIAFSWFHTHVYAGEHFSRKELEKYLRKSKVLKVTRRRHHVAYYFPLVDRTVAINTLRNNRVSYWRGGKNPN